MTRWDQYSIITSLADGDTFLVHDISETSVGQKMKRITWLNIFTAIGAALSIPSKASGAEVIAGTDDAKFATAKAMKDAGVVPVKLIGGVPHRQFWVTFRPTLTSGCAASAQIEMGTNKNVYDYLAFDPTSIEYAYANVAMPEQYTGGTIYFVPYWLHPATTVNFKVSFGLQAVSFSNDDTLDAAQGTPQYSNDEGGTTSDLYVGPQSSAITIAGTAAAGDLVQFRVSRKADDATNDTLAVYAYLLGCVVWYPVG